MLHRNDTGLRRGRRQRTNKPTTEPLENRICLAGPPVSLLPSTSLGPPGSLISLLPLRTINAIEGTPTGLQVVAIFSDPVPGGTYDDYHALIDWGDGSPIDATALITPGAGVFNVLGRHTFSEQGRYETFVTIAAGPTEPEPGESVVAHSDSFLVNDAPLTASGLQTTTLHLTAEINSGDTLVATFTDGDPGAQPEEFSATVDWGDGYCSLATQITRFTGSTFKVHANHAYARPGAYLVTTTITDIEAPGGSVAVGADTTAIVAKLSPPILSLEGAIGLQATLNRTLSVQLGTITLIQPHNLNLTTANFVASVDWGDGSPADTAVNVAQPGVSGAPFRVVGTHCYTSVGTFAPSLTVLGPAGILLGAQADLQVLAPMKHIVLVSGSSIIGGTPMGSSPAPIGSGVISVGGLPAGANGNNPTLPPGAVSTIVLNPKDLSSPYKNPPIPPIQNRTINTIIGPVISMSAVSRGYVKQSALALLALNPKPFYGASR